MPVIRIPPSERGGILKSSLKWSSKSGKIGKKNPKFSKKRFFSFFKKERGEEF